MIRCLRSVFVSLRLNSFRSGSRISFHSVSFRFVAVYSVPCRFVMFRFCFVSLRFMPLHDSSFVPLRFPSFRPWGYSRVWCSTWSGRRLATGASHGVSTERDPSPDGDARPKTGVEGSSSSEERSPPSTMSRSLTLGSSGHACRTLEEVHGRRKTVGGIFLFSCFGFWGYSSGGEHRGRRDAQWGVPFLGGTRVMRGRVGLLFRRRGEEVVITACRASRVVDFRPFAFSSSPFRFLNSGFLPLSPFPSSLFFFFGNAG